MRTMVFAGVLAVVAGLLCGSGIVRAGPTITGSLWENQGARVGNASIANTPPGAPDAQFNPAAIMYDSRVTGYSIATFLLNPVFFNTSVTFNPNDTVNNVFFLFTGKTFLHAGANNFVTPHDDGFEFSIPGAGFDLSQPGPTAPVNTPYTVNAPADGLYDFTLSYGECCGPPAVLGVEINGAPIGNVPEPSSVALLGIASLSLLGFGYRRWRAKA